MYKQIQKTIDWGVKIASIAITGPATWIVAGQLFYDIQSPILLFIMKLSAVFLVEGVLFSNWLLLEFDVKASPEIKARYAFTALIMYAVLAVIGFQHEGFVGIVFRIALLLALIGSGWDTYVYTWERMTSRVDRSVSNARRVKRHARRLAIREALMARESDHRVTVELNQVEETARLADASLYGERLMEQNVLRDREERIDLKRRDQHLQLEAARVSGRSLPAPQANGAQQQQVELPPENDDTPEAKKNGLTPSQAIAQADISPVTGTIDIPDEMEVEEVELESDDQLLTHSILDAYADDPKITYKNLAKKLGINERKIGEKVRELTDDGLLMKQGRARFLTEDAEMWTGRSSRGARPRKRRR
jgi:hypothetical protein